jgi:hypothetical protein
MAKLGTCESCGALGNLGAMPDGYIDKDGRPLIIAAQTCVDGFRTNTSYPAYRSRWTPRAGVRVFLVVCDSSSPTLCSRRYGCAGMSNEPR